MSEEKESIQDIFGQDILPGSLLAIRRAGKGYSLELSIVTGFDHRYYTQTPREIVRVIRLSWWGNKNITRGWMEIERGYNNNVIIVESGQAFLALNNDKIKRILKAVDIAKDEGLLPSDYKLARSFSDEQIFPEKSKIKKSSVS